MGYLKLPNSESRALLHFQFLCRLLLARATLLGLNAVCAIFFQTVRKRIVMQALAACHRQRLDSWLRSLEKNHGSGSGKKGVEQRALWSGHV